MTNPTPIGTLRRPQLQLPHTDPELPFKPNEAPPLTPIDPDQPVPSRYDDTPPYYTDEPPPTIVDAELRDGTL